MSRNKRRQKYRSRRERQPRSKGEKSAQFTCKKTVKNTSPQRRRGRRTKVKKLKQWQIALICIGIFIFLLLTIGVWYVYAKWSKIDTKDIKAKDIVINQEVQFNKNVDLGDGFTNVALFGVDSRDGSLGEGNRTDCLIVASLNNKTKEIKMVSVYRDTLLDLSEGTYQKCNSAYSYGGPVLAINMLNMNLDLDIQEYVTVNFGAIADAIDLLGGVEIDVTEEEVPYINEYIPETASSSGKAAKLLSSAGNQLLDGVQATTYARIRSTAGGDFTRTERQRLVIEKMFEKAKGADLKTLNKIIDKVFPQVSTSFTLPEILKYASAYKEYKLVGNMGFPQDNYFDMLSGIGSVVVPNDLVSNVSKMHEFLFGSVGYVPSSTVQTVNSNISHTVNSVSSSSSSYSSDYSESGNTGYEDSQYSDEWISNESGNSGANGNVNNSGTSGSVADGNVTEPVPPSDNSDSTGGSIPEGE